MTDNETTWRTEEHEECWSKRYFRYDPEGNAIGVTIIVKNGTPELIEAIKAAFDQTDGRFLK